LIKSKGKNGRVGRPKGQSKGEGEAVGLIKERGSTEFAVWAWTEAKDREEMDVPLPRDDIVRIVPALGII
jgi:hypothetical protein